jgi:hypothetical protein
MDVQSLYQNLGSWKGVYWRMRKKVRNDHPTTHNGQYYISKLGEFVFLPYHSYYYIKVYRKKRLKSLKPNNGHGLFDFNYYMCLGNGLFKIVTSYIVYSLVPHWLDLLKSMGTCDNSSLFIMMKVIVQHFSRLCLHSFLSCWFWFSHNW